MDRLLAAFVVVLGLLMGAQARAAEEYAPVVGQAGKDVVWVPTPEALVDRMLEMAKVTSKDYVMDLGSGDGRIAIAAAKKYGANAMGIEYNPKMIELSKRNAQEAGVANKVKFVEGDLFEADLGKADVITMYLLPRINMQLRPKLLALKPGTRIVSHAFDLGDWKPDETAVVDGREAYLWIVPAKVAGKWRLSYPDDGGTRPPVELDLSQHYQIIWGNARVGERVLDIARPSLSGTQIRFGLGEPESRLEYSGEVKGKRMEGTVVTKEGNTLRWVATRVQ